MRADALRKIGGYREQFVVAQDLDLFLRLAEVGRLANLPEVLLRWRQSRAASISPGTRAGAK
jgi:GT2 family glycosyltransferase